MLREIIICIVILVAIFAVDIITQNFTKQTVTEITDKFDTLEEHILAKDTEKIENAVKKLDAKWESVHDKLAYYIEHDELEKVESAMVKMKSFIKIEKYPEALAELEEGKFVMEHIEDKNAFNLKNVF